MLFTHKQKKTQKLFPHETKEINKFICFDRLKNLLSIMCALRNLSARLSIQHYKYTVSVTPFLFRRTFRQNRPLMQCVAGYIITQPFCITGVERLVNFAPVTIRTTLAKYSHLQDFCHLFQPILTLQIYSGITLYNNGIV